MDLTKSLNILREDTKCVQLLMVNDRLNFSFGQLCLADKPADDSTVS